MLYPQGARDPDFGDRPPRVRSPHPRTAALAPLPRPLAPGAHAPEVAVRELGFGGFVRGFNSLGLALSTWEWSQLVDVNLTRRRHVLCTCVSHGEPIC